MKKDANWEKKEKPLEREGWDGKVIRDREKKDPNVNGGAKYSAVF